MLADVEMGVTAELGRCRMTVRELLSLTPGAVIDLDRAAGAPVDVLVNGTLIARGEVVVIDEEFGIRISEILQSGRPRLTRGAEDPHGHVLPRTGRHGDRSAARRARVGTHARVACAGTRSRTRHARHLRRVRNR